MKLVTSLFSVFLLTFMYSCSSVDTMAYDESKTSASVDFTITDASSTEALGEVTITYIVDGSEKSVVTDESGHATVKGLRAGNYIMRLSKEGYTDIDFAVGVGLAADVEMPVTLDQDADVVMFKSGVTLNGKVKLMNADGDQVLEEGVTVDLRLGGASFTQEVVTTTTNADGEFTFSDLPEMAIYTVSVRRYTKGDEIYVGPGTWTEQGLFSGDVVSKPSAFVMNLDAPELDVDDINDEIGRSEDLVIQFSEPVDVDDIEFGDIQVTRSGTEVLVNVSWSASNTVLTISPENGDWGATGSYYVEVSLNSTAGDALNDDIYFSVGAADVPVPSAVTGFALESWEDVFGDEYTDTDPTSDAYYVTLTWNEVDDASGYEIWQKRDDDDNYELRTTIYDETDTSITLSVSGYIGDGSTVSFIITAYNDAGRSDNSSSLDFE
jgi:hypothetical protein